MIGLVIWLLFIDELGMITMVEPRNGSSGRAGSPSLGDSERDYSISACLFLINGPLVIVPNGRLSTTSC